MGDIYLNQQNDIESAVKAFLQSYQIFQQIGSPNSKVPESYLKDIIERIGEARFNKIIGTEGMLMLEQGGFVYPKPKSLFGKIFAAAKHLFSK